MQLAGCASEWDDNKELRALLRKGGSIFIPLPTKDAVEPSVDCAGLNKDALLPVMARLRNPETDQIGMVNIPHIELQLLFSNWIFPANILT